MAIFIYFAFRAGQLAFYSAGGEVDEKSINIYTLSILAIVTGMFTEQAYEKLASLANKLFKSELDENNKENKEQLVNKSVESDDKPSG